MPIKTTYLHCPVAVANTLILNAKRDRVVMDLLKVVTDRKPAKPFIFNVSGRTGHMKIFKKQH